MKVIYIAVMKNDRFLDDEGNLDILWASMLQEAYEARW